MNMNTNPIWGFVRTIVLFLTFRVKFLKEDVDRKITMEDGNPFITLQKDSLLPFWFQVLKTRIKVQLKSM